MKKVDQNNESSFSCNEKDAGIDDGRKATETDNNSELELKPN